MGAHTEDMTRREAIRERQRKEKENARRVSAANRECEAKLKAEVAAGRASVHIPETRR